VNLMRKELKVSCSRRAGTEPREHIRFLASPRLRA